jgi:hypothetical protein
MAVCSPLQAICPTRSPDAKAQQRRWITEEAAAARGGRPVVFLLDDDLHGRLQTEEMLLGQRAASLSADRIFSANFKSQVVGRLQLLGVEHAYLSCACLALESAQPRVRRRGNARLVTASSPSRNWGG